MSLKLGIMGPGRSGKDAGAEYLRDHFGLRYAGTTSVAISREVARREGITFEQAHAVRHQRREYWRALGDEMRAHDPAALAREVMVGSDLLVGVRARCEMEAVLEEGMVDLVLWIDRPGIPEDPTLEFGPELCHIIVPNRFGLYEYHRRLFALASALGFRCDSNPVKVAMGEPWN